MSLESENIAINIIPTAATPLVDGMKVLGILADGTEKLIPVGTGLTRPAELTAAINSEVTARNMAISTAVAGEASARDAAISTAIGTEVTNRNSAITTAINNLVNAAPGVLDTLKELADALGDDPHFAATVAAQISGINDVANAALALGVQATTPVVTALTDFVFNVPANVFSVYNDYSKRSVMSSIWIDDLIPFVNDVYINGKQNSLPLHNLNTATVNQVSKTFSISGTGYSTKNALTNLVSTKASACAGKQVRLLAHGDSITANILTDVYGNAVESWNYYSRIMVNIFKDAIDAGGSTIPAPVLIGHSGLQSRTLTYNATSKTIRGGNCGLGSWTAANYLRHAMHLTGTNSGASIPYTPNGQCSYYLLGLYGATGNDWTGSAAQVELIRTTLQGKYTVDKNAVVWNFLQTLSGWSGGGGSYTGSGTQNTAIDTFMAAKYANPDNPFFSLTKAQTAGATNAYSLATYLSRYKTLADDGTTRLVVGSTAGTLVTDATAYDVCTPTHYLLELGENDRYWFSMTAAQVAADIKAINDVIKAEYPAIITGIFFNPMPGTLFPERHSGSLFPVQRDLTLSSYKYDLKNALNALMASTLAAQKTAGAFYVPVFETFYPNSHFDDGYSTDGLGNTTIVNGTDAVHPGLIGANSMGDQLYAWIYYTLT